MVTPRQIDLVQRSFARVLPITADAARMFYDHLFALAPETRALFRADMADQGRKLFLTIAAVVDSLDRLDDVIPVAQALAVRHVGYGVRDGHYALVGAALIATLDATLGDAFDAETAAAWNEAYALLSGCMLAAARSPSACAGQDGIDLADAA